MIFAWFVLASLVWSYINARGLPPTAEPTGSDRVTFPLESRAGVVGAHEIAWVTGLPDPAIKPILCPSLLEPSMLRCMDSLSVGLELMLDLIEYFLNPVLLITPS